MNQVNFSGFLGSDPVTKSMPSGDDVVEFSLAVNAGKDSTLWVSCSDFGSRNRKMYQHFSKGSGIEVTGYIRENRAYLKKDGTPGASLEIGVSTVNFPPIRKGEGQATAAPASGNTVAVEDEDQATPF